MVEGGDGESPKGTSLVLTIVLILGGVSLALTIVAIIYYTYYDTLLACTDIDRTTDYGNSYPSSKGGNRYPQCGPGGGKNCAVKSMRN